MTKGELVKKAKLIMESSSDANAWGAYSEAKEFLRLYGGKNNQFLETLSKLTFRHHENIVHAHLRRVLEGFIRFVENDLYQEISPERKGQIDTVSDYLEQAQLLLDNKEVHGAAPAVIIGCSLEEFLRNWCEAENVSLENKKPSIDSYAKALKEREFITKQDIKDITSWAGIRNDAAHGNWEAVNDKNRIKLMLEGVNLFMRKYYPGNKYN